MRAIQLIKEVSRGADIAKRQEIYWVFEDILGLGISDIYLKDPVLSPIQIQEIKKSANIPYAYFKGEVEFLGYKIKVNSNVLIPRPETEELVQLATDKLAALKKRNLTILEIGTGSGCIGVSLVSELIKRKRKVNYTGIEISSEALAVSRNNFAYHFGTDKYDIWKNKRYEIRLLDALRSTEIPTPDVIISNPPYLTSEEYRISKASLSDEPKIALVGGEDGLDVYREIYEYCESIGSRDSVEYIFLELSPTIAERVRDLFQNQFKKISILSDSFGKLRFLIGEKVS